MVFKRAIALAVLLVVATTHKVANDDEPASIMEDMAGVKIIDEGE